MQVCLFFLMQTKCNILPFFESFLAHCSEIEFYGQQAIICKNYWLLCATFSWRFFSVKGLEQKIDRFVDYFHCPLEDEVDNWWEKNYTSSNTYNYIYTHCYLYNLKFIHSVHKQYPCFLLWYFQWLVLNFQTGRLKIIVMCILQNFKRNFGSGQTATHSICS